MNIPLYEERADDALGEATIGSDDYYLVRRSKLRYYFYPATAATWPTLDLCHPTQVQGGPSLGVFPSMRKTRQQRSPF